MQNAAEKFKAKRDYSVDWYTPAPLLKDMLGLLGVFDEGSKGWADPCTSDAALLYQSEHGVPAPVAFASLGVFTHPWPSDVPMFCNPPYGRGIGQWLTRCSAHGAPAVALVPASVDTKWWQAAVATADAVVFLAGRIKFIDGDTGLPVAGNPSPSCVLLFNSEPGQTAALCFWAKRNGHFYAKGDKNASI